MGELLSKAPLGDRLEFPDNSNFDALVEVTKSSRMIGFPEKALDRIYEFWSGMGELVDEALRLDRSCNLPGIPLAEREQAELYRDDLIEMVEPISQSMREFVGGGQKRSWKEHGKPIYNAIVDYDEREDVGYYENSIAALMEAISETKGNGWSSNEEMRQKIAQHAIEELWEVCDYQRLYWAAGVDRETTTIDEFPEEKQEFVMALQGRVWNESEMAEHKKRIRALRQAVEEIDDGTFTDNIEILWDTARGKPKKKTTAIDVFIAAEDIFDDLDSEGAFEWDPEEDFDDELDEDE